MPTRLKLRSISLGLLAGLISSSAFLLIVPNLWREINEKEALKQTLNIPSWAPLVEKSQPAVVVITTEAMVEQPTLEFPGLPGPFRFFMPMPPEKQRGQGSGFIINEDGYIITNQHVIDGAQKIRVTVGTKAREYDAEIIGSDEALDIALIKLKTEEKEKVKWPFLPLGDSDKLRLGDPVMALGSPLGLVQSVNTGIVSQKHRGGIRPSGRDLFVELIQMQMPINPGNSGGPVLDVAGRVVGVSESILASGQAIAFCVPINIIKTMLPQLLQNGQIDKAFLGVEPTDLTPQYAKALGLSENENGAVVVQVMPNTPAEKAGLKAMDVILEIDDKKVADSFNLRQHTAYRGIGQIVKLKIFRKGEGYRILNVKLEKKAGPTAQFSKPTKDSQATLTLESVGLELSDTPTQVKKELGLSEKNPGAQVVGVARRSSAEFASLQPGDVITEVDGVGIKSADQLKTIIDKAKKDSTLMMLTRRANAKRFVPLEKR
jgi:serine protease Do